MKRVILPILLLISMTYFADTFGYSLAIPSAFQNPEVKKKIMDALEAAKTLKEEAKATALEVKPLSVEAVSPK